MLKRKSATRAAQTHAATTPAEHAPDTETMAGVEADGGSPDAPARSPKEPSAKESLFERLAPFLPALDEEPAASPSVSHGQASEPAAETLPKQEETTETPAEQMHYVVCEAELGARIYKVPEGKLDLIGKQLNASGWKFFDDLEDAKVEAKAIFKRIAAARTAWGFSTSILEPALQDLMRQEAKNIPDFFA